MKRMNAEQLRQVEALFDQAVELKPARLDAWLMAACPADGAVRERVIRLVNAGGETSDARGGNIGVGAQLDRAAALMSRQNEPLEAGQHVGPYRLMTRLGHGGMGEVFAAVRDDDQLRKRVAIKVIKRGMDSESILKRFEVERQVLSSLNHQNIARLLDAGIAQTGQPYFVMEFIEGQRIDAYCDGNELTIEQRLKLFQQVCAAVQYAHENLIVHRDLKPSNILVDRDGSVKLVDFGIAKLLNPNLASVSLFTDVAARPMTPEYASPEQVRGEVISTRSDVYSLGVLLYELLSGTKPYRLRRVGAEEMRRVICEVDPPAPSAAVTGQVEQDHDDGTQSTVTAEKIATARQTKPAGLRRQLAGEIDIIVLMAMRKAPARRYESAAALSDDVRRFLAGETIAAHPESWAYQSSKFVKRHKWPVAVAVVGLAGVIGTAGVWVKGAREREKNLENARLNAERAAEIESKNAAVTLMAKDVEAASVQAAKLKSLAEQLSLLYELDPRNDGVEVYSSIRQDGAGAAGVVALPTATKAERIARLNEYRERLIRAGDPDQRVVAALLGKAIRFGCDTWAESFESSQPSVDNASDDFLRLAAKRRAIQGQVVGQKDEASARAKYEQALKVAERIKSPAIRAAAVADVWRQRSIATQLDSDVEKAIESRVLAVSLAGRDSALPDAALVARLREELLVEQFSWIDLKFDSSTGDLYPEVPIADRDAVTSELMRRVDAASAEAVDLLTFAEAAGVPTWSVAQSAGLAHARRFVFYAAAADGKFHIPNVDPQLAAERAGLAAQAAVDLGKKYRELRTAAMMVEYMTNPPQPETK